MSRRRAASADSLDLLLDTICNTFGGVLFIAILVIIIANVSGRTAATVPPSEAARQQLARARDDLAASQQELDTLRRAAQEQTQLARLFGDPKLKALVADSSSQQSSLAAAAAARASHLQDAAEAQAEANRVAEALAALDAALAKTQKQLAAIQQQLAAERQLRTRTVNLPKQRVTTKEQVAFLLRGGRLYAHRRIGPDGKVALDTADTQVVTQGQAAYLEPVAGGGTPVGPAGDKSGAIGQKIAGWNPRQHFLTVAVWPDSFEHFPALRQLFVERGFEYQLMPLPDGERVTLTDAPVSKVVQ
jgi:hypothetical protein